MASHTSRALLTNIGTATSRPLAFVIVGVYGVAWAVFDTDSFDWHGLATMITWLMTLFIQRAEHRDTQAIQAKLDELLRAIGPAHDDLSTIDDEEPEEIEALRQATSHGTPRS